MAHLDAIWPALMPYGPQDPAMFPQVQRLDRRERFCVIMFPSSLLLDRRERLGVIMLPSSLLLDRGEQLEVEKSNRIKQAGDSFDRISGNPCDLFNIAGEPESYLSKKFRKLFLIQFGNGIYGEDRVAQVINS